MSTIETLLRELRQLSPESRALRLDAFVPIYGRGFVDYLKRELRCEADIADALSGRLASRGGGMIARSAIVAAQAQRWSAR